MRLTAHLIASAAATAALASAKQTVLADNGLDPGEVQYQ